MKLANPPLLRLRRLRQHNVLRNLLRQTHLSVNDLIYPLFVHHGSGIKNPISSMPGQFQLSLDCLPKEIIEIEQLGIPGVILFGIPESKDATGSYALQNDGLIQEAVRLIKARTPNLIVMTDLCFCEYTDHGHCGVLSQSTGILDVDNDQTLPELAKQAVSHAQAGADVIAPSGMMDGMVSTIRSALDQAGYSHLPILSYAVKYASALYAPFREAAQGAPQFGNRKTYQMDPANAAEGIREAQQDVLEGADMLMVKPAHSYLDMILRIKQTFPEIPLAAYHVSGEYALIKAAAAQGWIDEKQVMMEVLLGIKRAGADFILTYFAKDAAKMLQSQK